MALDRQRLETILAEAQVDVSFPPFSIHLFETLPSTNQKLWNLLDAGSKPGTVVIATRQTAGRGQWGRQWSSPVGGLYLSVAISPNLPAHQSYQLTLCSAWGIATALRDRGIPVCLKWPNDLILYERQGVAGTSDVSNRCKLGIGCVKGNSEVTSEFAAAAEVTSDMLATAAIARRDALITSQLPWERKLGGILTETKVQQGRITKAIVGVGINWANPVPESGINLQSLQGQLGGTITSLEMLAAITLIGIASGNQRSFAGIDALLPDYEKLLINIGRSVCIDGRSGIIVGVTSTGDLRVRLCSIIDVNSVAAPEIYLKPGTISLGYI